MRCVNAASSSRSSSGTRPDSLITASPRVHERAGTKFVLYKGDGLGRSELSYAVLEDK